MTRKKRLMTFGEYEAKLAAGTLTDEEQAAGQAIIKAAALALSFGLQMKLAGAKQGKSERSSEAGKASWTEGSSRFDGYGDGRRKLDRKEIIRRAKGMLNAGDNPRNLASALEEAGLGSERRIRSILQDEGLIPTRKRT